MTSSQQLATITRRLRSGMQGQEDEDEAELYLQRAVLYRFHGTQWDRRGLRDAKLLMHKVSSKGAFPSG